MCCRKLKGNSFKSVGRLQWQQYQPHGTLQMVNRPVTIGTINDYMHERNGQKQEHPQRASPEGPKARRVAIRTEAGDDDDDDDDDDDEQDDHMQSVPEQFIHTLITRVD